MYGFKLQIRIAVAVWNMKILAWKVTWIFERSYFCPCLDFLRFLAQRCLASAHFSLSVLFCVSLVPMAAVAETTDASAGDSVRTFLDTDCAVSTVFFGSQYKISAQFFLSQQNNLISCPFVKPLYLSLMRVLVVFYLWVNFVLVKRSPASKFTSQSLTYLVECFVSCCVFPYTFWYIGAGLQILLRATSQHKHHTSSPRIIHLIVLFWA